MTSVHHIANKVTLNNGIRMPMLGLGVFQVEEGDTLVNAVKQAIKHGYRSIDTASIYGNEESVGKGIKEALRSFNLRREDIFVTSKVWNADLGFQETITAFEKSLEKLQLDYLDLYLIHWPVENKFIDAWKAMETLYRNGKIKAIGVSNFQIHHLELLIKEASIIPAINQVEYHPRLTQVALNDFCKKHQIQLEAWSPLMQAQLLDNATLKDIAARYQKSPAQIILRWDIQNNVITIPKSTKEHRIIENANIFDFTLTEDDMKTISALNQHLRVGPDPDNFDF